MNAAMQPLLSLLEEITPPGCAERLPQATGLPVDKVMTSLEQWILRLHDIIHAVQRTTSPGPSGLGIAEMQALAPKSLKTLTDMRKNGFMRFISVLLARMLTGTLTPNENHYLMTARLIPLAKKSTASTVSADALRMTPVQAKHLTGSYPQPAGKPQEEEKWVGAAAPLEKPAPAIRPVACMEQLRRVFDTMLMRALLPPLRETLSVVQFAVEGDGLGHLIRAAQAAMEDPTAPPRATFMALDLKNAYNSLSRYRLVQLIREVAPMLLPYARETLGQSSRVYARTKDGSVGYITVTSGVPQGSAMSTLLFALATMGPLLDLQSRYASCGVAAAHDDVLLHARSPEEAMEMANSLAESFAKYGLQLSRPKTLAYAPNLDLTDFCYARLFGEVRRVPPDQGFILLGIPVGHRDWVKQQALDNLQIIAAKWRAVQELETDRRALYGYTIFVMRHQVTYLMRHLSPAILRDFQGNLFKVDGAMDELFTRLTARNGEDRLVPWIKNMEADKARIMAEVPRRYGGLGLWQFGKRAPIAWLAAMLNSFAFAEGKEEQTVSYGGLSVTPWVAQTLARQRVRVNTLFERREGIPPIDTPDRFRGHELPSGGPSQDLVQVVEELRKEPYWQPATARILDNQKDTESPCELRSDTREVQLLHWLVALSRDRQVKLQRSWTHAYYEHFCKAILSENAQHGWGDHWRRATVQQACEPDSMAFFSHRLFYKLKDYNQTDANDLFAVAARLRIGAPLDVTTKISQMEERTQTFASPTFRIALHDEVNDALATVLRAAGSEVRREPRLYPLKQVAATVETAASNPEPSAPAAASTMPLSAADRQVPPAAAERQVLSERHISEPPVMTTSADAPFPYTAMDAPVTPPLNTFQKIIEGGDKLGAPMIRDVGMADSARGAGMSALRVHNGSAREAEVEGGAAGAPRKEAPRTEGIWRRGDVLAILKNNDGRLGDDGREGEEGRRPSGQLRGRGYAQRQMRRGGAPGRVQREHRVPGIEEDVVARGQLQTWLRKRGYVDVKRMLSAMKRASILGDTLVQNLWAKSYSELAASSPRKALARGEQRKRTKYGVERLGFDLQKTLGVKFVPFVVSHMGVLGTAAVECLDIAAGWVEAARGHRAAISWKRFWRRYLSARIVLITAYYYKRWEVATAHHQALGGGSDGATPAGKMSAISGKPMRA